MALRTLLLVAGLLSGYQAYDLNLIRDNSWAEFHLSGFDRIEERIVQSEKASRILHELGVKAVLDLNRVGNKILAQIKEFYVIKEENVMEPNLTKYFKIGPAWDMEKPFNFTFQSFNSYIFEQDDLSQNVSIGFKYFIANQLLSANEVINKYLMGNFSKEKVRELTSFGICDVSYEHIPLRFSKFYRAKSRVSPSDCSKQNAFNSSWNKEEQIFEICKSDTTLLGLNHYRDIFTKNDTRKQSIGLTLEMVSSDPKNECL